ncbi:hypothetical protein ACFU0X_10935, partial [Streptomyces cellulosae]
LGRRTGSTRSCCPDTVEDVDAVVRTRDGKGWTASSMTPRKIAEVLEARAAGGASGDGPHLRIHEEGLLSRRPVHTPEGAPCEQGAPSVSRLPGWSWCGPVTLSR